MIRYRPLRAAAAALLLSAASTFAKPTNNPVLAAFPASGAFYIKGKEFGNYSWTDEISWGNVYSVTTDLTSPPFNLPSNVTKDDLPPNHPNADHDDITGHASDDLALVNQAITVLSGEPNGGVLYFEPGVYVFSDNIVLKDGVVLRGANPTGVTDARTTGYDPPTDFFFPRLTGIVDDPDVPVFGKRMDPSTVAASTIPGAYVNPGDPASITLLTKKVEIDQTYPNGLTASNYGIVNVDLHRAGIQFLQEFRSDGTIDRFSVTFGSDDKNRMEGGKVVVFGNRLNNVVDLEWLVAQDADFNTWQLWPNRAAPHIDVMAKENSIVANNRVNDFHYDYLVGGDPVSTNPADLLLIDSFGMATGGVDNSGVTGDADTDYTNPANLYLSSSGATIIGGETGVNNASNRYVFFRHTQGNGVAVNRSSRTGFGGAGPSNPAGEPALERRANTVRQNWVFVSNRIGYKLSGFGLEVRDNVRVDRSGEPVWLTSTGQGLQNGNGTTYENRGVALSGSNIYCNGNDIEVYRRLFRDTVFLTVDGQGIFIQPNDGQDPMSHWTVTNNTTNGSIALAEFGIPELRTCNISSNSVTDGTIDILANPSAYPGIARDITLNNNTVSGTISLAAALLDPSTDSVVTNNTAASITLPDYTNSVLSPSSFLNDEHYVLFGNSPAPGFGPWASANTEEFPLDNLIDEAPRVKIVSPAVGEALGTGSYTVQVEVTTVGSIGSNALDTVILYDCSQLLPGETIMADDHRTNANSLAGATTLALNGGTGYYEGSWNITQAHLDYGLFVVEALMTEQTIKDGVNNDPAIDRPSYRDSTFAILGIEDGKAFTTGDPDIAIASGTDPTLSFDMVPGGTYILQKRTSLTSGTWEYVTGQIVTNGNAKAVGMLSDAGALPGDPEAFYRVVQR